MGHSLLWAGPPADSERRMEGLKCNVCRGIARFCKLSTCPFYRELLAGVRVSKIASDSVVSGPTPPSILVGERGYPRVNVGPAVSLLEGPEAGHMDSPVGWLEIPLARLLALRLSLFHGRRRRRVSEARRAAKFMEALQESAASAKPVDIELYLGGPTVFRPGFGVRSAPYGPSAVTENVRIVGNVSVPRKVDDMIAEAGVRAEESLTTLYRSGFDEYYLTRIFSAGLLGRRAERRLVPTEWSITAVDDILSRKLYREVKEMRQISGFRLHSYQALENAAHVVLTPTPWMYELLEGWLKHSSLYSDYEFLKPRRTYAEKTGGAYYAVRLAVLRHLHGRGEQCGAIVFFEVLPGWIPLGVWRFREIVKRALESSCLKFHSLREALDELRKRLQIPLERYLAASRLVPLITQQGRLDILR
ncbi:MAG: hypothetical protein QW756_04260 [Nitrososphaerota archaeon]